MGHYFEWRCVISYRNSSSCRQNIWCSWLCHSFEKHKIIFPTYIVKEYAFVNNRLFWAFCCSASKGYVFLISFLASMVR